MWPHTCSYTAGTICVRVGTRIVSLFFAPEFWMWKRISKNPIIYDFWQKKSI